MARYFFPKSCKDHPDAYKDSTSYRSQNGWSNPRTKLLFIGRSPYKNIRGQIVSRGAPGLPHHNEFFYRPCCIKWVPSIKEILTKLNGK